jgi:hypothetical protein
MKKFIQKAVLSVKALYNKYVRFIRDNFFVAVIVTNKVKEIVRNPLVEGTVNLVVTPGEVDNRIWNYLNAKLPVIYERLVVANNILLANDDNSDAFAAIIDYVRSLNPDAEASFYQRFAGEVNLALADDNLSIWECIKLGQLAWSEWKSKNK